MLDRKFECLLSVKSFRCVVERDVVKLRRLNVSIQRFTDYYNTNTRFVGVPRAQLSRQIELLEIQRKGIITTIKGSACENCPFRKMDFKRADFEF